MTPYDACAGRSATVWTTTLDVRTTSPRALDAAYAEVMSLVGSVDAAASRFRPDSEVAALAAADGRPLSCSALLRRLVRVAIDAAEVTDGLVDPTLGSVLVELGYGSAPGVPATARIRPLRRCDWHDVEVDDATGTVRVPPGVLLDLGATAKAWTADTAARRVTGRTGAGTLVSIGGDLAVSGDAPDGGWPVVVRERPESPYGRSVTVTGGGLATSGTQVRRWRSGAQWRHHLVDPATGRSAQPVWRTVTAAAASCVDANVATTAAVVMGGIAPQWLEDLGLPARLVSADGRVRTVAGWPEEEVSWTIPA
jgi:thiamine biosynthesis lipoprotein